MLSRFFPKASRFRLLSIVSSKSQSCPHFSRQTTPFTSFPRYFSSNHDNNGSGREIPDSWKITPESDAKFESFFSEDSGNLRGIKGAEEEIGETAAAGVAADDWLSNTEEEFKPWSLGEEEKADLFDLAQDVRIAGEPMIEGIGIEPVEKVRSEEEERMLQKEEQELTEVLKGPNRAFGDLIAVSGITDDMLDSLIALKNFEGIQGLPPLREIEDMRYEKSIRKSTRAEIERQKQEEIAKARVRKVDEKGRAYGTGRRKCSIARVWIQPGEGKFIVNDKAFDVYFPMLEHRATLIRPFSETNTLGLWDVDCTVKGGGVSGQVGAIRLGISRALQNWEPDLRPPLRSAGFLTRDSRVVERKKPGKAKARKSFQWVKR